MDWQELTRNWRNRLATDLVSQLCAAGVLWVVSWLIGALSGLPIWAYLRLAIFVVGATLWAINQYRMLRQKQFVSLMKGKESNPAFDRLLTIAEDDKASMNNRIIVDPNSVNIKPQLHATDPYVDLLFSLTNTSIFGVTLFSTEGKIGYERQPLQSSPLLMRGEIPIKHAQTRAIRLRQHFFAARS